MQDLGNSSLYLANDLLSDPSKYDSDGGEFLDWRLPTKRELNLLYEISSTGDNGPGFNGNNTYKSSTDGDYNDAWIQRFSDGYSYRDSKQTPHAVRAVRAF